MPGRVLPSRNSSDAPPPVEMCPKADSAKPSWRTAAAESPPPTTVRPGQPVRAGRERPRPVAVRLELEDAHRAVPEDRAGVGEPGGEQLRAVRTDVQPHPPGGDRVRGHDVVGGVGAERVGGHHVDREHHLDAQLGGPLQVSAHGVELVGLQQAGAHLVALGGQEGVRHAAADQDPVGLGEQVVDHAELVRHLRPAEHDGVRPLRLDGQPAEHVDLGQHQPTCGVRQPLRDVVDAGLLAVHHPEAVADEDVGERGQLVGEGPPLGSSLLVSPALKRRFSSTTTSPSASAATAARAAAPTVSEAKPTGWPRTSPRRADTGRREYFSSGTPFGRPRWATTTTRAPASRQPADGRRRRADPPVVRDGRRGGGVVEWDVEVAADEHAPAAQVAEVLDGLHCGSLDCWEPARRTTGRDPTSGVAAGPDADTGR